MSMCEPRDPTGQFRPVSGIAPRAATPSPTGGHLNQALHSMHLIPSTQNAACATALQHAVHAEAPMSVQNPQTGSRLELFYNVLSYREPTLVYIDGANFKAGCDKINVEFDYRQFWNYLFRMTKLVSVKYYAAMTERDNDKFVRWLSANGFQTYIKMIRDESASAAPTPPNRRKNIDAELATDMALIPFLQPDIKHLILCSGDGDFAYTVKTLQDRGVRVSCLSPSLDVPMTTTARTLMKQVDFFVPLETFVEENQLVKSVLENGRKVTA